MPRHVHYIDRPTALRLSDGVDERTERKLRIILQLLPLGSVFPVDTAAQLENGMIRLTLACSESGDAFVLDLTIEEAKSLPKMEIPE